MFGLILTGAAVVALVGVIPGVSSVGLRAQDTVEERAPGAFSQPVNLLPVPGAATAPGAQQPDPGGSGLVRPPLSGTPPVSGSEANPPLSAQPAQGDPLVSPQSPPPAGGGAVPPGSQGRLADPSPANAPIADPPAAVSRGSDIEVNPLAAIDLEAVGTLDQGNGGFGSNMWNGSKRHVVTRLMARLPEQIDSPVLRGLARRLLLSSAIPPSGEAEEGQSLLRLRVERLADLGEFQGLVDLLRVVPARFNDETIQRARVEAELVTGHSDDACAAVRRIVSQGKQTLYWQKAMVFCQIQAGEMAGAALGVGLLREQYQDADADGFVALAEAASAGVSDIPRVGNPSVFEVAMLSNLDAPLSEVPFDEGHPATLVSMINAGNRPTEEQAGLAEWGVGMGVLPVEDLAKIYRAFEFTAPDHAALKAGTSELSGVPGRALRFQVAEVAGASAKEQAEAIHWSLESTGTQDERLGVVRLYEALLTSMEPTPELSWFSDTAGQALFALGEFQKAEGWVNLAREQAMTTPAAAAAVTSLWPYARLAGLASVPWDGNMESWKSANRGDDPVSLGQRVALVQISLRALGGGGPLDWSEIAASGQDDATEMPDASILFALDSASGSGRLGETVLLSLLVLGDAGPGSSHLLALERVLTALTNVGLEREARMLAIEAALARGV